MLYTAKAVIFSDIHIKHKHTLYGQNAELCFNLVLCKVTKMPYKVKHISEDNLVP